MYTVRFVPTLTSLMAMTSRVIMSYQLYAMHSTSYVAAGVRSCKTKGPRLERRERDEAAAMWSDIVPCGLRTSFTLNYLPQCSSFKLSTGPREALTLPSYSATHQGARLAPKPRTE